MAAYAALVSLLNNIHAITNHPTLSTSFDNKDIQPLLEKTGFLLDFIEGNNHGGDSKEPEDLERQIAVAAHAAEDVIESHIVDLILGGTGEASLSCSLDLQQSIQGMGAIMEKIVELKERCGVKEEKPKAEAVSTIVDNSGEIAMVGLDVELNQLLDELTRDQSGRQIISIVGMGGSGKTTLAKNIYENKLIKEHFQFRAWATISQQNDAKENFLQLLSSQGKFINEAIDDLGLRLHKSLVGRRYLIILDDIWDVEAWYRVKRFFPDNNNRSRILLTTRLSNVAKDCGSTLFRKNLLDKESSWKLFCVKAFGNEHCPPELEDVAHEIVKSCKGLALSIVVIGGHLLYSPRTVGCWEDVAKNIRSMSNSKEKQESLDVLSLSYNHLPPHLKPCFLYMGVFEEDSETPISRIVKLWVAEGFIKPIGSRVLEEIAEGYIQDLIDRNLILVGRRRKNGKIRSCGIHDLLRDLCIKLAEKQTFFIKNDVKMRGTERRFFSGQFFGESGVVFPLLRTIIVRRRKSVKTAQCRLLRVLDDDDNDGESYHWKVNLRYLAIKPEYNIELWDLPASVCLTWNLQTFIVTLGFAQPSNTIVAQTEFWKMRQIRHVLCHQIYLPCPPRSNSQDGLLMLGDLQTLQIVVNLRLTEEVCRIIPNIKKLHLLYDGDLEGYDDSLIECLPNLVGFHKLESLKLSIKSSEWPSPLTKLNKKLLASFPSSINKLCLSDCMLPWDDMRLIGSLPQLEVLRLEINAFDEGSWGPITGQFLRLKFLEISHCGLEYWDADNSHFPVLQKLILEYLLSLEEVPMGIGDIPTLEFINVHRCSDSAAISAVKLKEDQLENEDLTVQVTLYKSNLEDLKKKLEIEGLTIKNIQLHTWP